MESKNSPPRKPIGANRTNRTRPTVYTGHSASNREITYHVGWKTVKITADRSQAPHSQHSHNSQPSTQPPDSAPHAHPLEGDIPPGPFVAAFLRWAWHPAPWLPKRALWPLLWCAPVICFAVTLAVVALLKY